MPKIKKMENSIHRIFEGQMRICASDKDKNYRMELMLLNEKKNRNGWVYEKVANHILEFGDIPVLASVVNGQFANSHDFVIKKDPKTGKDYASFIDAESEHIWGWIPASINGEVNPRMKVIDGVEWATAEALVPSFYNTEFIQEIEKHNGQMRVSIETLVTKNRIEGDTEYEEEYTVIGVTVLNVPEAVAGANIRKLSAEGNALEEVRLRVASFYEQLANKEPQTQKILKGDTKMKVKAKDLEKLLNGEFTVLSSNGDYFGMLSKDAEPYLCSATIAENGEIVVGAKIALDGVEANFVSGENAVSVKLDAIVDLISAENKALKKMNETLTKEATEAKTKVSAMEKAENDRRKEEVKNAINSCFAQNKCECDVQFADNLCDDMLTDEKIAEYASMTDKDGKFIGAENAKREVDARCMNAIREASAEAKKHRKNSYAWNFNGVIEPNTAGDDLDAACQHILND